MPARPRRRHGPGALAAAVAVAAAAFLGVAGCRGTGDGPSAYGSRSLPGYDIGAAPRGDVRDGGTLRLAVSEFRTQWNYWHVGGPSAGTVPVLRTTLPWLFRSDAAGAVAADPDYLVRARVTRTRPRQVVVYDLNPRARWSDGAPIGYRDFRALWRACGGRDPAYACADTTGYDRIARVARGTGAHQVVVTFARPFGEWRSLFGPLYPARTIAGPRRWAHAWLNRMPVTAGPFRPARIDPAAESVTLERDPAWWGARPRLDRVVFRYLSREAMPGALRNGEIDGFDAGPDTVTYRRVAAAPGVTVRRAAGPDFTQLTFNGAGPILEDPAVRAAVARAIDRRVLARSALGGLGVPARVMNDHVYVNTQRGYRDNAGPAAGFDPAAAARLLDRAGWRLGAGGVRRGDGRALTLRYVYPASAAVSRHTGELVQEMLRRVGVRVVLRPVPDNDLFTRYLIPGDYDIAPFTWHGTPFPVAAMAPVYARPRGGDVRQNLARIGSRRLDAALARAIGETDPERARRDADAADRMIWAEVHSLPLYQRPQIVPVRSGVANWGAFGLADPVWPDVGFLRRDAR